jgi:hypothetical protein
MVYRYTTIGMVSKKPQHQQKRKNPKDNIALKHATKAEAANKRHEGYSQLPNNSL